tara:strand:+ start:396 stop:521 length:126 start_codon:yes stop_codon:yes gene_type:complete
VFIKVKIDNLNDSSKLTPPIDKKIVNINNEIMKIKIDKKYL